MKHTPGPWKVEEKWDPRTDGVNVTSERGAVASALYIGGTIQPRVNARLIAAAPELLEALKLCVDALAVEIEDRYGDSKNHPARKHKYDRDMSIVLTARAVIEKAETP